MRITVIVESISGIIFLEGMQTSPISTTVDVESGTERVSIELALVDFFDGEGIKYFDVSNDIKRHLITGGRL